MSSFDLAASIERGRRRLGEHRSPRSPRRQRSDAGRFRLHPDIEQALRLRLLSQECPNLSAVLREMEALANRIGEKPLSRATLYNYLGRAPANAWCLDELPPDVVATLHNVDPDQPVPGHHVALRAFQDGSLCAVSWAAGMPWWDLWQARRRRGWRPRSKGLLDAVCRTRGIR